VEGVGAAVEGVGVGAAVEGVGASLIGSSVAGEALDTSAVSFRGARGAVLVIGDSKKFSP
jgi:hypothetical protein